MFFPRLIKKYSDRYVYIFLLLAVTIFFYQSTNRIHLFEPQLLPMWWVDRVMPFWPWTIWLYISEYVIFFVAMFGLRDNDLATKYFYAYMAIFFFSLIVFVVYPVTFPRADFELVGENADGVSAWALRFLRDNMDTPANCLPSLHVSSCYISALPFRQQNKKTYYFMMVWSAFVSISTMTTKQHYFIDILTAIILTVAAYYFFFYRAKFK